MTSHASKTELLKAIRTERRRLEKSLSSLSEEELIQPGVVGEWSVKDVLAHLVEWERLFLDWYRSGIDGRLPHIQPVGMSRTAIDQLNQQFFARNRSRLLQDVLADFQASYNEILDTVQEIPDPELFSPGGFVWTGKWVLADYIAANTSNHYRWANTKIRDSHDALRGLHQ